MSRLAIGISIGKNDLDIAAWYNMLKSQNLSLGIWTGYLILAYRSDIDLDIGTVKVLSQRSNSQNNLMFGSGNSLQTENKKSKRGWGTRGTRGEFVQGSIITIVLYNKEAIYAFQALKKMGFSYSSTVKMLIRKYLKIGEQNIPPTTNRFMKDSAIVSLQTVDKSKLFSDESVQDAADETALPKENQTKEKIEPTDKPATEKEAAAARVKNPLLDYI